MVDLPEKSILFFIGGNISDLKVSLKTNNFEELF